MEQGGQNGKMSVLCAGAKPIHPNSIYGHGSGDTNFYGTAPVANDNVRYSDNSKISQP